MWKYNHTTSNELYHYGIKGMKWGVRRAENFANEIRRAGNDGDFEKMSRLSNQAFADYKKNSKSYQEALAAKKEAYKEGKKAIEYRGGEKITIKPDGSHNAQIQQLLKNDKKYQNKLSIYLEKRKVAEKDITKHIEDTLGEYGNLSIDNLDRLIRDPSDPNKFSSETEKVSRRVKLELMRDMDR